MSGIPGPTSLQELLDAEALRTLSFEYAYRLDRNDMDALLELFTEDCEVSYGPLPEAKAHGIDEYRVMLTDVVSFFSATSHHLANVCVQPVSADTARVRSVLYAWHRYTKGWSDSWFMGQYHDVAVRTADGWKFREKTLLASGVLNFHTAVTPTDRIAAPAAAAN